MIQVYVVLVLWAFLPCELDAACPGGWKIFKKNCYKKFPGKKSWDDAVLACEGKKAALAEVLSQGENDFIQKQIGGNAWIGVTRCHTSSTCILDYTPAYYRNWAPGQPDKKPQITLGMQNNEFAVFMKGNGKWDDEPKQKGYDYICKKPEDPCKNTFCNPDGSTCKNGKCICKPGFSGELCYEQPCDADPCQNEGTCEVVGTTYKCTCVKHFSGKDCEVPPPCEAKKPCKNGTCVNLNAKDYKCNCNAGWTGKNCDVRLPCEAKKPCKNGACVNLNANDYKCNCNAGWTGKNCDVRLPCEAKKPCVNGVCVNLNAKDYKCNCKQGWIGKHCDEKPCDRKPCVNAKKCINVGNSYRCICKDGWKGTNCEKDGSAGGDPHYMTFDRKRYDFMGKCEYIYAKDCGEGHAFEILQQNEACGWRGRVSCTKSIRVIFKSVEIIMERRRVVYVNGKRTNLPWARSGARMTRYGSGAYLTVPDLLFSVRWDGGMGIYVKINQRYEGQMCGLMGNADGNARNDFQLPDKSITTNVATFGNSWKKNPRCVNGIIPKQPCKSLTAAQYTAVKAKCAKMKAPPFRACNSKITPDVGHIPNCEYDLCAMNANPSAAWCQALEKYDRACSGKGVNIDWEGKAGFEECGNPCANMPCFNGAKCDNLNRKQFKCTCSQGFSGVRCENSACKRGYIARGNLCYRKMSRRPWRRTACRDGEQFVSPKDIDENDFIFMNFVKPSKKTYWMNARVCGGGKLCDNSFGTVFFHNFIGPFPKTGCVQMPATRGGKWLANTNCKIGQFYICKYENF